MEGSIDGSPLRGGRDPLTGALVRERLHEEITRALAEVERYGENAAVCVLDLDNFRFVNEVLGHDAGDGLLAAAAAAMAQRLRSTDALGRLGGDEFAVVLPRTDREAARAVADDLLAAVRRSALWAGADVHLTASIGVAAAVPGAFANAGELLAEADLAMAAAKAAGRDRLVLADPAAIVAARGRAKSRLSLAARIRDALETGGLELYAQPIVALHGRAAPRYELLVRMRGPEPVAPAELIATAERFGQIQAIDGWVLGRALDLLDQLPDAVLQVNLAAGSIGDPQLTSFVERALQAAAADAQRLVFEITETAAIADVEAARHAIQRLRGLGCHVALDDFGAGFASFSYLKQLPFDMLKIDGEFVSGLPDGVVDRLAVGAIAQVARGLGMATVGEYVSSDAGMAALRELGVDFAQGFHLGGPQPVDALLA